MCGPHRPSDHAAAETQTRSSPVHILYAIRFASTPFSLVTRHVTTLIAHSACHIACSHLRTDLVMIDLQALPFPIYLILFILTYPCILAYKLIAWSLLGAAPPTSPNISPSSYTPLPATLITPPLAVPYEHHFLTTPNSRVHYITTSPPAAASSSLSSSAAQLLPPVLFVHGFPDWWYVWRHQIVHFTPLCRQCVAIDIRGYGYSEVSGAKDLASKYTFIHLCSDILAVLDELKIARCVLVGFDWGGMVVWDMARRYPSRVAVWPPSVRLIDREESGVFHCL